jgi:hypothetical protein
MATKRDRSPKTDLVKKGDELYHPRPGGWWYIYKVCGITGEQGITVEVSDLRKNARKVIERRKVIPWGEWSKMTLYSYPKEWQLGIDP